MPKVPPIKSLSTASAKLSIHQSHMLLLLAQEMQAPRLLRSRYSCIPSDSDEPLMDTAAPVTSDYSSAVEGFMRTEDPAAAPKSPATDAQGLVPDAVATIPVSRENTKADIVPWLRSSTPLLAAGAHSNSDSPHKVSLTTMILS